MKDAGMIVEVTIPDLGEGVTDATVVAWHKSVGAPLKHGELLAEIMTDKVNVEIESPNDGVLTEIVHGADAMVRVGDTIGLIEAAV
jgi:pyruvate/2-oxoglutarate dehydrogenase complex dihydrolipoamide acyltransferase (E2) component